MPDRVVVFDTSCLLCSKFIRILLAHDNGLLSFTGFESSFSQAYLPDGLLLEPETVVFYEEGRLLVKSRAIFAILKFVGLRYRWLRIFRFLPVKLLDIIYDWIASNRYAWFGQLPTCYVPSATDADRFID